MLSKGPFYWQMMRKYVVVMAHILSDIHVQRFDNDSILVKDILVPVTYAGKSKIMYLKQRDPKAGRMISTVLPRISFLCTDLTPDPSRRLNNLNTMPATEDPENPDYLYQGQPWNFNFSATVWAKHMEDLLQIVEQMAVFFKPDLVVTVSEISSIGLERKIQINLEDINLDVSEEFTEEDRTVMADFTFNLKGWLYPALSSGAEIIKEINIKFESDVENRKQDLVNIQHKWNEINSEIDTTHKIILNGDTAWKD